MKRLKPKYYIVGFITLLFSTFLRAQIIDIPDSLFLEALIDLDVDIDDDGLISQEEAILIDSINLWTWHRDIESLEGIEYFTNLRYLNFKENEVVNIDISNLSKLEVLICHENKLEYLDCSQNFNLEYLNCKRNRIDTLLVASGGNLREIDCSSNHDIKELDFTNCQNLERIELMWVELEKVYLTNCSALEYFNHRLSSYGGPSRIENFDVTDCPNLEYLYCNLTKIETLDLSQNTKLKNLNCYSDQLENLDLTNNIALEYLAFAGEMETMDFSNNIKLKYLKCNYANLAQIDLSALDSLEELDIRRLELEELDLTHNKNLKILDIGFNNLTEIDLSQNSKLEEFNSYSNPLEILDFSNNTKLKEIDCSSTNITSLYLLSNVDLEILECDRTDIGSIDVSANPNLVKLSVENCDSLEHINTRNGIKNSIHLISSNNIHYVCKDDEDTGVSLTSGIIIDTYCNFTTGGTYIPVIGKMIFAEELSECSTSNVLLNNIKFKIEKQDTTVTFSYNTDEDFYRLILSPGEYEISPFPIHEELFQVEPPSVTIDIHPTSDTIFQDFCLIPVGDRFADVYVKIIPIGIARPGFNMDYKILIGNSGNIKTSGEVNFTFPDSLAQFVSASEMVTNSPGLVTIDYQDLQSFEDREILVTLRLNSPMDTPPLNDGDRISLYGEIFSPAQDLIGNDNAHYICHDIVNSYDPNDKRCLQGDFIELDSLIDRMDYLIRFENEGTAEAVHITIRDSIDSQYFDVESLRVLTSSHNVHVEINGDVVEFIFEDIYLPFEDESNDGFVAFEVRLNPEARGGDIVRNNADIFFDYNFPIRTNTVVSTLIDDIDGDGFYTLEDCDENNPDVNPDSQEIPYNGLDDDCDELTLDDDLDQDGFPLAEDCDDMNDSINPGTNEICGDGIDQNCDGIDTAVYFYLDQDMDGFGDSNSFVVDCQNPGGYVLNNSDCDDNAASVHPNADEVAYNGLDDDCNPATLDDDLDQDGFLLADDCDDTNADINPNAEEIADNQIDEDCDGFDLITSIFELSSSSLKIFPNPVIDHINIEVDGQLEYQVNIFDFEGRIVHSSVNSSRISTVSFSGGTYIIEVKDLDSDQKVVERIVVGK